jgi:murein DD-endopeptidase MepM/ murein hydrolase activator NlpD
MAQGQLNAGHLGGRFLERTIPQKVNSVPSCETEIAMPTGQKLAPLEANRRGRTSIAMIGLAISMGAHSLLLPQAGDGAIAAEPVPGELAATENPTVNVAAASHPAASSSPAASKSAVIEHTVQEGQTIQQLARFYGVDAIAVASTNGLSLEAVLRVGQVLKIPTSSLVARVPQPSNTAPEYYGLVSGEPAAPPLPTLASGQPANTADTVLKIQQDEAVNRLAQKREGLRASLLQMKADQQAAPSASAQQPQTPEPALPSVAPSVAPEVSRASQPVAEPVPPTLTQLAPSSSRPSETALVERMPAPPAQTALVQGVPTQAAKEPPAQDTIVTLTNSPTEVSYQVNAGDTLSAIARSYNISEQQLAAANQITNPNLIRANQMLKIPGRQSNSPGMSSQISAAAPGEPKAPDREVPVIGATTSSNGTQLDTASLIESRLRQAVPAAGAASGLSNSNLPLPERSASTPSSARIATTFTRTGAVPSRSEDVIVPTANYSYVESLKADLLRLREKYSAAEPQSVVKVATISGESGRAPEQARPDLVNPEFSPRTATSKASGLSIRTQPRQPQVQGNTPAGKPQPQKVATASLGSQNYSSLTSSMVGQMVSPSLPPLGSAEAYLPGRSGKFAGYIWPAQGMLSSGYGWRWGRMHKGIDIAAPVGTPIVAAAGGKVSYADWSSGGYGNLVEITHPDGSVTLYAHNNRILVREGQEVAQGEQIAEMGSTGYSTGPHSHFEVHIPGQGAVNPISYLSGKGAS